MPTNPPTTNPAPTPGSQSPATAKPAAATPATPATATPAQPPPLTGEQRAELSRLLDEGHKAAVITQSPSPALAQLGAQLGGILIDDYHALFPARVAALHAAAESYATAQQAVMAKQGPKLWAALHPRAYVYVPSAATAQREALWLASFANLIPCGKCRVFYLNWLKANPPPLTATDDPLAYFRWTVDLHNAVNIEPELDKPVITYGAAQITWAPKQALS